MAAVYILILYLAVLIHFSLHMPSTTYTLTPSQSLIDGQTLTSQGGIFVLGFFSPSNRSTKRYLGIWYNSIPVQTVVWVANRDSPLDDMSGALKIGSSGDLLIVLNQTDEVIWSSNTLEAVKNPVVEFLESGNLVLRDLNKNDSDSYLWQSFDYPSDTFLPGMKQGWNLKTGRYRYISSWKKVDDPSHGDYTYGLELVGSAEFVIRKGPEKYYRAGSWNGVQTSGSPELKPNERFTYQYINNGSEAYLTFQLVNPLSFVRLVLKQTISEGVLQGLAWAEKTNSWVVLVSIPRDICDQYALCGAYSICDIRDLEICQCLEGFKPKSPDDWNQFDWSLGCERKVPVKCSKDEGFKRYTAVKLPETTKSSWINRTMHLDECRLKCLSNCSCVAYSNLDIRDGGSGCVMWFTDLVDMRKLIGAPIKQDFYIRMASSELDNSMEKGRSSLIVTVTLVVGLIALASGSFCILKRKSLKGGTVEGDVESPLFRKNDDPELPLFDLVTIKCATNNFAKENMLGEGGFGPVYKGRLDNEEEIAVKRLSKDSTQGVNEFKNEVLLISKLQHRNLVKMVGCCTQGEEKLLIYEYMQNNSLESFLFDNTKRRLLDWEMRYQIILGIARGLLYLHRDSRLRIIHRDLKASNILLDSEMVAKISDFGMARIFGGDQTEERTRRVVGTRGYMSPEYAIDGRFSVKSDVFSFGVLLLEIVSGKRNWGFSHPDHDLNLLGHAWRLWSEGKPMKLVDESMDISSCVNDITRCIQIGLLCVQQDTIRRPTMSTVVLMLSSETSLYFQPRPPGFYIGSSSFPSSDREVFISNDGSITTVEPR